MRRSKESTEKPAARNAASRTRDAVYGLLVTLCFVLGAASRFYGAWTSRHVHNSDTGIVALMVKHMAEGREWPVFFYGQAYMGTLEPMVSVVLTLLLGITGFAVCAGTALVAVASLPVIFCWARDAAGRAGALAALALCAVGPYFYFMFQFAPRGGYTLTLLLGLLVMWLSTRTAVRIRAGRDSASGWFFLIGLLAGLGWWTNQLITPALLAGAVVLAVGLRGRVWKSGPALGLLGFLIGSLPYWLWNLQNDWASLNMFSSAGGPGIREGLRLLWERYTRLIGLDTWPAIPRTVVLIAYPLGAGLGLGAGLARRRKEGFSLPSASSLTLSVFAAVSILTFVGSSFATMNTPRYLVPLVPAGAILAGLLVQRLRLAAGAVAAGIPVVLLAATHWAALPELRDRAAMTPTWIRQEAELSALLQAHGIEAVYSHFMDHLLNFNLGESVVVTEFRGDRYAPYARRAELADKIAILRDDGKIAEFPRVAGGSLIGDNAGGYGARYGFAPPGNGLTDITTTALSRVLDRGGRDCRPELTDCNIDTDWSGRREAVEPEWLELQFDAPVPVRGLRLLGLGEPSYPAKARIDVRPGPDAPWQTLYKTHPVTDFFWSGPRPFWGGRRHRLEYRFPDVTVSAIRVVSLELREAGDAWRVSELRCFGPGPELPSQAESLAGLMELLRAEEVRTLYCDRWAANRVHEDSAGSIRVELEPSIFPESPLRGGSVNLEAGASFLVERADLPAAQAVLGQIGLDFTETEIGPWVLLTTRPDAGGAARLRAGGLYWTGFAPLTCSRATPARPVHVDFPRGITLSGFTVEPPRVSPGGEIQVSWFWQLARPDYGKYPAVFVHFRKEGGEMFQDDHLFFGPEATWRTGGGGDSSLLWDRRTVQVPADAAPGNWDIHVGLYDSSYGKRFRPRTKLPTARRAVVLKDALTVQRDGR